MSTSTSSTFARVQKKPLTEKVRILKEMDPGLVAAIDRFVEAVVDDGIRLRLQEIRTAPTRTAKRGAR